MKSDDVKAIRIALYTIALLGFLGFIGASICNVWLSKLIPQNIELPLAEADGLAVDDSGQVYVASTSYNRLQAYDDEGRFLWSAYIGVTSQSITISAKGRKIEVTASTNHIVFDTNGNLLHKELIPHDDWIDSGNDFVKDNKGSIYCIRHPSMWPQVVKRSTSGKESVVVSPKLYLWIISGPFPHGFYLRSVECC